MQAIHLSVLIPTANRVDMLRTALASVARQTVLHQISEIIVIENGGNDASRALMAEFPQLPIRYIYREVPIPPSKRGMQAAWHEIGTEYFACLLDDDWWDEFHLENSIQEATKHPGVASIYSSCLTVTSESSALGPEIIGSSTVALMADAPQTDGSWRLSPTDLLMIALVNSSFHYSTLVGKTGVWRNAIDAMPDNTYDTDRVLSVLSNTENGALFINRPGAWIRVHLASEARKLKPGRAAMLFGVSTDYLLSLISAKGINVTAEFQRRRARCRGFDRQLFRCADPGQRERFREIGMVTDLGVFFRLSLRNKASQVVRRVKSWRLRGGNS